MTTTNDTVNPVTGEVTRTINTAQLREIREDNAFADAMALLTETYGDGAVALASDALGDGFALLDNKDKLIGVKLLFVSWTEVAPDAETSKGDHGYVVARVVTARNEKFVVTDGSSTGINVQLRQFSAERGRRAGMLVERGLRRSDYKYDDNGKMKDASTHYIDTGAGV